MLNNEKEPKKYISNAFSLGMLKYPNSDVSIREVSEAEFNRAKKAYKSVVGHKDTARVLGVPFNRESIKLGYGEELYVAQLQGGRLPEGATKLPDGFKFSFLLVHIYNPTMEGLKIRGINHE